VVEHDAGGSHAAGAHRRARTPLRARACGLYLVRARLAAAVDRHGRRSRDPAAVYADGSGRHPRV
jgi:hypothetical protein